MRACGTPNTSSCTLTIGRRSFSAAWLSLAPDLRQGFLEQLFLHAAALQYFSQPLSGMLFELRLIAPQPFADIAFQQSLISGKAAHRRHGLERLDHIGRNAHGDRRARSVLF